MINSWKSFVYAIDQMRELQKKADIRHFPDLYARLKKVEAEVDEACDKKIAEWSAKEDLFAGGAGYSPGGAA